MKGDEPIYPSNPPNIVGAPYLGLRLRDYFAAQAVAGVAATMGGVENVARRVYEIADAMLEEREKPR